MADMKQVNLYLTVRQLTMLKKEAQEIGVGYSEVLRRILDKALEEKATK